MPSEADWKKEMEIRRAAHKLHSERSAVFHKIGQAKPLTEKDIEILKSFEDKYLKLEEEHNNLYSSIQFYHRYTRTGKPW